MELNYKKDAINVEKTDGVATVTINDKKMYEEYLPEDIDAKTAKRVFDHTKNYINSSMEASQKLSVDILNEDKSIDVVHVSSHLGTEKMGGSIKTVAHRQQSVRMPGSENKVVEKPTFAAKVTLTQLSPKGKGLENLKKKIVEDLNN